MTDATLFETGILHGFTNKVFALLGNYSFRYLQ